MTRRVLQDRAVLGGVSLVAFAALFVAIATYLPQRLLAPDGRTLTAQVRTSMQLAPGDPVRVGGVKAGEVTDLELADDGRSTLITMEVYDDAWPVYRNARLQVRWRTLVGALYAVDLDRGTPDAGELGGAPLPVRRTASQVELEDIARVARGRARAGLRTVPGQLSEALRDHRALDAAFRTLDAVAPDATKAIGALRGTPGRELRRTIRNTSAAVHALDRPVALHQFVEGAGRTLAVTAARREDLRRSLRSASTSLPAVRRTARRLDGTVDRLDGLVGDLSEQVPAVAPSLRRLRPTLVVADRVLADARPLLRQLRPTAAALASAARTGNPLIDGLAPILGRLDRDVLPDLALESPSTKHATYEMIGPTIAGLLAPFSYFDDETHFVRFLASGGEKTADSAPCTTFATDPSRADEQLVTCAKAARLLERIFDPGTTGKAARSDKR